MAQLAFLGLGIMGYPMARNLLRAGQRVALWSRTAAKARQLAQAENGVFCETPRQAGEFAECAFLCVGDTAMSEQVILGQNGLVESTRPGSVIIDCSTVSPNRSRRIGEKLAEKGIHFLDAPCTGSKPGAEGGTLTFMVGGDKAVSSASGPTSNPWGNNSITAGGQAWACTLN